MDLSVIIPAGRRDPRLARLLADLARQELGGLEVEVLVVVNPPAPALAHEVEAADPGRADLSIHALECSPSGANRARNVGIARAEGELLYFIDDDCALSRPDHLARVVAAHRGSPEFDGLGGLYRSPQRATRSCVFYNAFIEAWLRRNARRPPEPRRTELAPNQPEPTEPAPNEPEARAPSEQLVLVGGNASYHRAVFAKERFDDRIVYGGDETEFNHRLIARGFRLGLSAAHELVHDFRSSWWGIFGKAWLQGRGRSENPSLEVVRRESRAEGERWPTRNDPRPRWLFRLFLVLYALVVRAGALRGGRAGMDSRRSEMAEGAVTTTPHSTRVSQKVDSQG